MIAPGQLAEDALGFCVDLRGRCEGIGFAAFVVLLRCVEVLARLSSPRIDVLEKTTIDFLDLEEFEPALYRVLLEFGETEAHVLLLTLFQNIRRTGTDQVVEGARS